VQTIPKSWQSCIAMEHRISPVEGPIHFASDRPGLLPRQSRDVCKGRTSLHLSSICIRAAIHLHEPTLVGTARFDGQRFRNLAAPIIDGIPSYSEDSQSGERGDCSGAGLARLFDQAFSRNCPSSRCRKSESCPNSFLTTRTTATLVLHFGH
jgi:hypothetical protein